MGKLKFTNGVEHEITPFHKIVDTEYPYGKFGDDGIFRIVYHAVMDGEDGGYDMLPVYGVKWDDYLYRIYIGEPPHKKDDGAWTTYNPVPNFLTGAFAGAHFIDKEPDKPHFIRIMTEAFDREQEDRHDEYVKEMECYRRMYENPTFSYCFKGMFKSIGRKLKRYVGGGKGTHMYFAWVDFGKARAFFGKEFDGSETFFDWTTDKWVRRLYLRENGKFKPRYSKWENDGTCSAC